MLARLGGDYFPAFRDAGSKEDLLWLIALRQLNLHGHIALVDIGLRFERNRTKGGGSAFDVDAFAIFEPAFGGGEEKAESVGFAVGIKVKILHEEAAQDPEPLGVAR